MFDFFHRIDSLYPSVCVSNYFRVSSCISNYSDINSFDRPPMQDSQCNYNNKNNKTEDEKKVGAEIKVQPECTAEI